MPGRNPSPPPAELLSILRYDPATGVIVWTNTLRGRPAGRRAGNIDKDGYRVIGYAGRTYRAHHLAWLIEKGEWPEQIVDHRNGDSDDNRIDNLRLSTPTQNSSNRKLPVTNTSGYKGVVRHHRSGRWNAQIKEGDKTHFLGAFDTAAEAARAYDAAALELRGEFARLNFPIASNRRAAVGAPVAGRLTRGPYRPRKTKTTTPMWTSVVVMDLRDYADAA